MEWQPIARAPFNDLVQIKIGRKIIRARFVPNASLDEKERECSQWQAEDEDYPKCWSDGCCWASNMEGVESKQPDAWRYPPTQESKQ